MLLAACLPLRRLRFTALLGLLGAAAFAANPDRHVVLISIDGFPAYLWRDESIPVPHLRRLAAGGAVAGAMTIVNPAITWPNHTTLVTGVSPRKHGVLYNGLVVRGGPGKPNAIEPWVDRARLVFAPTVYDAAFHAGLTTAEVDWVAITRPGTITWSFGEVPDAAAVLPRENPRDIFIAADGTTFSQLKSGAKLGTSSVRRQAQALRLRPDLKIVPLRGNVETRLAKLARGEADAIGMTRAMVADPQLANKVASGRLKEIELCTGCNQACIGHYHAGTPINCAINPWTGREATLPRPTESRRKIVIVGGGPAGCAAVRAAPGADIVLFERSPDGLGGQWRHALAGPSHEPIARLTIENLERWAQGAEVRLGIDVTAEQIIAEQPDLVVLASGATEYRPPLEIEPGASKLLDGWALLDGAQVEGSVVVWEWGGDWTGFIAAEILAVAGHKVRLASSSAAFGEGMHQYQRNLYLGRLDQLGVELVSHVEPLRLGAGELLVRNVFSEREMTIDDVGTLVVIGGREPYFPLYEPLIEAGINVERVGDCLGARTTEEAVHEATVAALAG